MQTIETDNTSLNAILKRRFYYFWKKLSERQSRKKLQTINYKPDIERYSSCKETKPARQINHEMRALQKYWGCYPFQYYRYDFYRNDCMLSLEKMKQYVPHFFMMNLYFPLSFKEYGVLCEDKVLTYGMFKAYDVLQAKTLFWFDHKTFYNTDNSRILPGQVDDLIEGCNAEKLFVKPRFGLGGRGIEVFNKKGNKQFVNAQGVYLGASFFVNRSRQDFYIVQEGLVQHQNISRIYPHAINTFRIITEYSNEQVRVLYAIMRMGKNGSQIDNAASAGGIYTKVDVPTGSLDNYALAYNRTKYLAHPDTGFVFKGSSIKEWNEIKQFAMDTAQKLREIKYIGWDIALTVNGPAAVEVNNGPDMGLVQDFYGGIRDDLNIKPNEWWFKTNYTLKNL